MSIACMDIRKNLTQKLILLAIVLSGITAADMAAPETQIEAIEKSLQFVETGTPSCVDVTNSHNSDSFRKRISEVAEQELRQNKNRIFSGKEKLSVADCGVFYTVLIKLPDGHLGSNYLIVFRKNVINPEEFANGIFSIYWLFAF
ncbi:MAG: hypothetical protein KDE03_17855 [Rhodobacteraceae bacterium]|nr:hypothetical protein [Paracoccaceae bacterium]